MIQLTGVEVFGLHLFITVIVLAFAAELINALLGGGHGAILTPLLIMLGFKPLSVVPAVLLAEVVSGVLIGVAHHRLGNVDFRWRSNHLRVALLLGASSVVGVVVAVAVAVRLTTTILEAYIGVLILLVGFIMLFTLDKRFRFSWSKILALGVFAAFNKGISGGGYGPLVTGGQLLTGLNGKQAVAITSLAKSLACVTGIFSYFVLSKGTDWGLAPSLVVGAAVSVPFSAFIVKRMYERSLRVFIGVLTIVLGLSILAKLFLF
ncbi:MAG: hypothetical protein DRN01_02960 [Thermoplasmata archaeon]|nr:MAG: hypothetical protein DRN01_02960 [Thermoplasmata archaeon]